ncbi:MAG: hypothetical protein Q7S06_01115 [Nanoarchaeota archaeon]|nr:hypothetical protein [Nanoarchaeota archaeon]
MNKRTINNLRLTALILTSSLKEHQYSAPQPDIRSLFPTTPNAEDYDFLVNRQPVKEVRPDNPEIADRKYDFEVFLKDAEESVSRIEERLKREEEERRRQEYTEHLFGKSDSNTGIEGLRILRTDEVKVRELPKDNDDYTIVSKRDGKLVLTLSDLDSLVDEEVIRIRLFEEQPTPVIYEGEIEGVMFFLEKDHSMDHYLIKEKGRIRDVGLGSTIRRLMLRRTDFGEDEIGVKLTGSWEGDEYGELSKAYESLDKKLRDKGIY